MGRLRPGVHRPALMTGPGPGSLTSRRWRLSQPTGDVSKEGHQAVDDAVDSATPWDAVATPGGQGEPSTGPISLGRAMIEPTVLEAR